MFKKFGTLQDSIRELATRIKELQEGFYIWEEEDPDIILREVRDEMDAVRTWANKVIKAIDIIEMIEQENEKKW